MRTSVALALLFSVSAAVAQEKPTQPPGHGTGTKPPQSPAPGAPAAATAPDATEPRFTTARSGDEDELAPLVEQARKAVAAGKDGGALLLTKELATLREVTAFRALVRANAPHGEVSMAPAGEPGPLLLVRGNVKDRQGRPVADALVYAYQTSAKGWYSDRAPHFSGNGGDFEHARLFAYVRTDANGGFVLRTVRPGGYPRSTLPEHIHLHIDVGGRQVLGTEIVFVDDARLTAAARQRAERNGFVVTEPRTDANGTLIADADVTVDVAVAATARVAEIRTRADANPYSGRLQRQLGFALREAGRLDDAVACFTRAAGLGDAPAENAYNVACTLAVSARPEQALDWLERALDMGFADDDLIRTDTDMDALRALPRFRALTGFDPPAGRSRTEQWRYDLDFFARRMERMHWDLYAKVSRQDFAGEVAALQADAAQLTDGQVRARLRRLLARVGDGHTLLRAVREGEKTVARFPLDLYLFADGLHVRAAPEAHAELVGGRVQRLGNLPVQRALEAMKAYVSVDNDMGYRDWAGSALCSPDVLEAIGAVAPGGSLAVEIVRGDKTITQEVTAVATDLAHLRLRRRPGFTYMNDAAAAPLPLWRQNPDRELWFAHVPEAALVYFWFGAIADPPGGSFATFCDRLFDCVRDNNVARLVVDLRGNGGGNTGLLLPFLHGLIRCEHVNAKDRLFVIVGRRTFSAAMNCASLLELHTAATFVGEPTGSRPNFVGESTSFVLPHSRYRVFCSSRYWQHVTSTDKRPWIAPEIVAEPTAADDAANRDVAMEAIVARVGAAKK